MSEPTLTIEEAAARFVVDFSEVDIDIAGRRAAKTLIKDQLAIQVGASQLPWSKQVRHARMTRPGKSTIVGDGETASAEDAAFLNATYGHGFEYDDYAGNAHPGCCVVPVAIAIGEELDASFEEVLVAMVAGYELYVRIGYPASPALLNRGWQSHSVLANFGAAAVAAKLRGLDAETTLHALAIALSHAGGTTEYASTGGSIKRAHAGISARNGMESVDLAVAGVTGPRRFLTGDRGFYKMFSDTEVGDDAQEIFSRSNPLSLVRMSMKPYCCCAATHVYIDLMQGITARAREVQHIEARIQTMADAIVGNRNASIYQPQNIEEVQYSLPVEMALAVLGRGNGYATHRTLLDGELWNGGRSGVIDLANRITLTISPELDRRFPRTFAGEVAVIYNDGSTEEFSADYAKGTPEHPFTDDEFRAKFDDLTKDVIGKEAAAKLFDLIDSAAATTPISALTALLR
ncbi:MAG: MmgE/PrpD family protein [Microbacteriaceae bacterium]|nr:MAG: MmgE/PrpD family protein [Microbacteriaceae bacterium]